MNTVKVYSQIWVKLNQKKLGNISLEEESDKYPVNIEFQDAINYFEQISQYKIIDITNISDADYAFLEHSGLSLEHIKSNIIRKENCIPDTYKSFEDYCQYVNKGRRNLERIYKAIEFQTSLLIESSIKAVCPVSGETVFSNRSFVDSFNNVFYRFIGRKVFYLITGDFWYEKLALYLPLQDILIKFTPYKTKKNEKKYLDHFKSNLIAKWHENSVYISSQKPVKKAFITNNNHFAHHLWNELSSLHRLLELNYLEEVDVFLFASQPLGSINTIFPEISQDKIKTVEKNELHKEILNNNYFVLSFGNAFIRENLAKRVNNISLQKCSPELKLQIDEAAKKHFPLLWISIRLGSRTWILQERDIVKVINNLAKSFPDLGVVIDGFSLPENLSNSNFNCEAIVQREKEIVSKICAKVSDRVGVYDTVGCYLYESITWANAVDLYLAHQGSIQHKIAWTANKPGMVHTNSEYYKIPVSCRPGSWERENATIPIYVSVEHIKDVEKKVFIRGKWRKGIVKNYECNWRGVYKEVLNIVLEMQSSRSHSPGSVGLSNKKFNINNRSNKMLGRRFERLNALAKINSASKYLEIGVCKGVTFNQVNVPFKVAVDPNFQFDTKKYSNDSTIFHEITSDNFFTKASLDYKHFDLIYLDGLHTFEQTFRDFCASLKYSHPNTMWLIDDTHPTSMFAAEPDRVRSRKLQRIAKDESSYWMGDIYKVVFAIHDFFPQFSYATFPGHGQTVVWAETRKNFAPIWNSLEKITNFKYDDFLEYKNPVMNIKNPSDIIQSVENYVFSQEKELVLR